MDFRRCLYHTVSATVMLSNFITMAIAGRMLSQLVVPFSRVPTAAPTRLLIVTAVVWISQSAAAFQRSADNNRECYRTTQNPYELFGTKTTYGLVAGNELQTPSDCSPVQIWMMSRHGTRYPSKENIEELKALNKFKTMITAESTMCPEDIAAIRNWNINLTRDDHYMLNRQGIEEIKSLAIRLKRQFPQIFNVPYSDNKFKFLSSRKPRAKQTATVFFQSMFNHNPETEIPVAPKSDERIYLNKCRHVNEDDDNSREYEGEVKKFQEGPQIKSVVYKVSMAMGLKQNLSYENISLMLTACKYDKAWYIHSRPAWCAVFTREDLEILEYIEDLMYYYDNGYGNPFGESMGCPVVKDLIDHFKDVARGKTAPLGIFYFGHSPNVLSIIAKLGIGKDNATLLSTNFEEMKHRQWRTSYLNPFASNVIAVFYRCREGNKVMFLLNEHAIPIGKEQCKLCPWEPIETQFDPMTSNNLTCNLDMCTSSAADSSKLFIIIITCICIVLEKYSYF